MVVDQYTDPQNRILFQLKREFPREILMVKTASLSGGDVPDTAFADPDLRRFPLHTPGQALLSKLYAIKQAELVPADVMGRIDKALDVYGIPPVERVTQKEAADVTSHYLLPQHQALLVKEAAHVPPVADALLQQRYKLTLNSMVQAATGLVKKAADFGLRERDLPTDVFKYAGLTTCDVGILADWVEARAVAAPTAELREDYEKVAQYIAMNVPVDGILRDRRELIKIATLLERIDEEANLAPRYGRTLLDPMETVFNMDKVAESMVTLAGRQIPMSKLQAIPGEVLEEVLGPDVLSHVQVGGATDPAQFAAMLSTLPADLQGILYKSVQAYL